MTETGDERAGPEAGAAESLQRLFLAIPISDRIRELLRARLAEGPLPGRPVPPENWHITLRFLGATSDTSARALMSALREASLGAGFAISFGRPGAFPGPARASVLWLGIEDGAAELAAIAAKVEQAVRSVGFPAADHPFRAHLTLSRLSPAADVRPFLDRDLAAGERMDVTEVVLFRSRLGRGPAVYEPVDRISLVE